VILVPTRENAGLTPAQQLECIHHEQDLGVRQNVVEDRPRWLGIEIRNPKLMHHARRPMRDQLDEEIGPLLVKVPPFEGRRCERPVSGVMQWLGFAS
jgi:hypothetical protein